MKGWITRSGFSQRMFAKTLHRRLFGRGRRPAPTGWPRGHCLFAAVAEGPLPFWPAGALRFGRASGRRRATPFLLRLRPRLRRASEFQVRQNPGGALAPQARQNWSRAGPGAARRWGASPPLRPVAGPERLSPERPLEAMNKGFPSGPSGPKACDVRFARKGGRPVEYKSRGYGNSRGPFFLGWVSKRRDRRGRHGCGMRR